MDGEARSAELRQVKESRGTPPGLFIMRMPYELYVQHDHFGNADHLLSEGDRAILDECLWYRAGGDVICEDCQKPYYDHPPVIGALWLQRLCNGDLVHL